MVAKTGSPRLHYNSGPMDPATAFIFIVPGGSKLRFYLANKCGSSQQFEIASVLENNNVFPVKTINIGSGDNHTEVFEMLGGLIRLTNSGGECENGHVRWFVYTN